MRRRQKRVKRSARQCQKSAQEQVQPAVAVSGHDASASHAAAAAAFSSARHGAPRALPNPASTTLIFGVATLEAGCCFQGELFFDDHLARDAVRPQRRLEHGPEEPALARMGADVRIGDLLGIR